MFKCISLQLIAFTVPSITNKLSLYVLSTITSLAIRLPDWPILFLNNNTSSTLIFPNNTDLTATLSVFPVKCISFNVLHSKLEWILVSNL